MRAGVSGRITLPLHVARCDAHVPGVAVRAIAVGWILCTLSACARDHGPATVTADADSLRDAGRRYHYAPDDPTRALLLEDLNRECGGDCGPWHALMVSTSMMVERSDDHYRATVHLMAFTNEFSVIQVAQETCRHLQRAVIARTHDGHATARVTTADGSLTLAAGRSGEECR